MKKLLLILALMFVCDQFVCAEYVPGYVKRDGTVIQGYYRTRPDNNMYNNYSTQGNTNPFTLQPGYVQPQSNRQIRYTTQPSQPTYSDMLDDADDFL